MNPVVFWGIVGAGLLGLAVSQRRRLAEALRSSSPQARVTRTLLASSIALLLLRFFLADSRGALRSVDEYGYQALGAFCRTTGTSLFACLPNLRSHHFFLLVPLGDPSSFIDLLASVFFGSTAFLLGLTLYRASGNGTSALLVPPLLFLGSYSFEGLTSNAECFANAFLAAYILVRFGAPNARSAPTRSVLAGVFLGLAFLFKEQAGAFVLAEALIAIPLLRAEGRLGLRSYAALELQAALGFLIPVALFFGCALASGQLHALVEKLVAFVSRGGRPLDPPESLVATERAIGLVVPLSRGVAMFSRVFLSGVGLLALLPLLDRGSAEAERPPRPPWTGLILYLLVACLAISTGLRFFEHYFLLLMPPLAILGAVGLANALAGLRKGSPKRRWVMGCVLAFAATASAFYHWNVPRHMPRGFGLMGDYPPISSAALYVRRSTPPDGRLFVGGWRPELYAFTDRAPAARAVAGGLFELDSLLADLRAHPPAAVIFPGKHSVEFASYALKGPQLVEVLTLHRLERLSPLRDWLEAEGYEPRFEVEDIVVWSPGRADGPRPRPPHQPR